jgi:hypothetical protein
MVSADHLETEGAEGHIRPGANPCGAAMRSLIFESYPPIQSPVPALVIAVRNPSNSRLRVN